MICDLKAHFISYINGWTEKKMVPVIIWPVHYDSDHCPASRMGEETYSFLHLLKSNPTVITSKNMKRIGKEKACQQNNFSKWTRWEKQEVRIGSVLWGNISHLGNGKIMTMLSSTHSLEIHIWSLIFARLKRVLCKFVDSGCDSGCGKWMKTVLVNWFKIM